MGSVTAQQLIKGVRQMKEVGCIKSHLKKYRNRPSPPYPANRCCNMKKVGNDGDTWVSVPDRRGICRWRREKILSKRW